jgi:hypothetical protein
MKYEYILCIGDKKLASLNQFSIANYFSLKIFTQTKQVRSLTQLNFGDSAGKAGKNRNISGK